MNGPSRLPYYTLMTGIVVIVIVAGFIGGVLLFGAFGDEVRASGVGVLGNPVAGEPTPGPTEADDEPTEAGETPSATAAASASPEATSTQSPTSTVAPPTETPIPPTATPTPEPTGETVELQRAEGGESSTSTESFLPFRQLEAGFETDEGGSVEGAALLAPRTFAQPIEAGALVYNTFVADQADVVIEMDVSWHGVLYGRADAAARAAVTIMVNLREVDADGSAAGDVEGFPIPLMAFEIGDGRQPHDQVTLKDSRHVRIHKPLEQGATYRLEFQIVCQAEASFANSITGCDFWSADYHAEWSSLRLSFLP